MKEEKLYHYREKSVRLNECSPMKKKRKEKKNKDVVSPLIAVEHYLTRKDFSFILSKSIEPLLVH